MRTSILTSILTVGICTLVASSAAAQTATSHAEPRATTWSADASVSGTSFASQSWAELMVDAGLNQRGGYGYGLLLPTVDSDAKIRLASGGDGEGISLSHGSRARVLSLSPPGSRDTLLPLDARYQLDRGVRPELSRPPGLLRRTYSSTGVGATIAFIDLAGWRILSMGLSVTRVQQDTGAAVARHTRYDHELTFATWTRQRTDEVPELQIDIISGGGPAIAVDDGPDAALGRIDLVAVRNAKLLRNLYIDASAGVSGTGSFSASVTDSSGEADWETTVMTENLPLMSTPTASLKLHGKAFGNDFALELGRGLELTSDVQLVLDHRISVQMAWSRSRNRLAIKGFAARSRIWTDKDTSTRAVTGGALTSWQRTIGHGMSLTTTLEMARSFYADLDGAPQPRATNATRMTVMMTKRLGRSRKVR